MKNIFCVDIRQIFSGPVINYVGAFKAAVTVCVTNATKIIYQQTL